MTKTTVKFYWDLAWQAAAFFAGWTSTQLDDKFVAAMRTDDMFNDFWSLLVARGWVAGSQVQVTALDKHLDKHDVWAEGPQTTA